MKKIWKSILASLIILLIVTPSFAVNTKISQKYKDLWEREIIKLQEILKKEINKKIDNSGKSLEKYLYVQEKGNMKVKANFDLDKIWNIKTSLNLKDYFSNTQLFNNHLKTNLEFLFNWKNTKKESMSLNISTYLEFIVKDWESYLLLKNLNSNWKNLTNDIKIPLDTFSKIFDKNNFIKMPDDKKTKEIYRILKSFSKNKLKTIIAQALEKPLLTPYKKVWRKYYLIPTKHACDLAVKNMATINPYIFYKANSCTKEMYQKILMEMEDNNIKITLKNWKLAFKVGLEKSDMEKVEWFIQFESKVLSQINFEAIPPQKKYPWEKFLFNYKKFGEIKIYLNANKKEFYNDIKISLDRLNRINKIKIIWNINNYRNKLNYNFNYKNHQFNWNFENNSKSYYDKKINKTIWKIDWITDYKGNIKKMNLNILANNWTFNLKIDNKKFEWKLDIKELFLIKINWKYEKKYFKVNSNFELAKNPYITKEKITWKFNIETDLRNWKDNANILFILKKAKKEFFNFSLENIWKVEYKKQEIKAPKNFRNMEDVMQ